MECTDCYCAIILDDGAEPTDPPLCHECEKKRLEKRPIQDRELATLVVARLNALIENPDIRSDVELLCETRVLCSQATVEHPTLQAAPHEEGYVLGVLGLLNGILGVNQDGEFKGMGYLGAQFNENDRLVGFVVV